MLLSKWSGGYTDKFARNVLQAVQTQLSKGAHDAFPVESFNDRRKRIDFEETELTRRQSPFQVKRQKLEAEEISMLKQMLMKK